MCIGRQAGHRAIPAYGKMIKHNRIELHGTASNAHVPVPTMEECAEFNRAADRWLAKQGQATGDWKKTSHCGITHRTSKRRPSCGG